ncbi:MAG: MarR family transcriptional regulator [Acidimicrobiia bacterium]|nr:MarR family transcriptional regulator [Acidimicrobiia bacterium]
MAQAPARSSAKTKWLTPAEMRTWRAFVDLTLQLRAETEQALLEAHGLTEGEYGVLVLLSEAEDRRLRMCDLAAALRLSPSGLTRRIDGLVKRGYVTREPSPGDRRVMLAVLTEEGLHTLEAAAPTHVASVRASLIDHLDPEDLERLADLIEKVHASRGSIGPAA